MNNLQNALCAALVFGLAGHVMAADIDHGKELATKKYICTSCHGAQFDHPIDPSYPILAGQYADYLAHALNSYKHGDNQLMGRKNAVMAGQAAALSDVEISDITAYIASLPGPLVQKK